MKTFTAGTVEQRSQLSELIRAGQRQFPHVGETQSGLFNYGAGGKPFACPLGLALLVRLRDEQGLERWARTSGNLESAIARELQIPHALVREISQANMSGMVTSQVIAALVA